MEFNEKLKYYMTSYNISSRNINSSGNNIQVIDYIFGHGTYLQRENYVLLFNYFYVIVLILNDTIAASLNEPGRSIWKFCFLA